MIAHGYSIKDRRRDAKQRKAAAKVKAIETARPVGCVCQQWPYLHDGTCPGARRLRKWVMFLRLHDVETCYTRTHNPFVLDQLSTVLEDELRRRIALGQMDSQLQIGARLNPDHLVDWIARLRQSDARIELFRGMNREATKGIAAWVRHIEVYGSRHLDPKPKPVDRMFQRHRKRIRR